MANLKFIRQLMRPFRWLYALCFAMLLMQMGGMLATTGIQQFIIDRVFINGDYGLLPGYIAIMAGAIIVQCTMITAVPYVFHIILFRMRYYLYEKTARFIQNIPVATYNNERIARYADVLNDYLFTTSIALGFRIPQGLFRLLQAAVLMVIVGWYSPVILGAVLLFSTLYGLLGYWYGPKLKAAAHEVNEKRRDLGVFLEEGISATREVIALHRRDQEAAAYKGLFQSYFAKVMREGKVVNRQLIASQPIKWAANLFILIYGGYETMQQRMSIGHFVVVYQFATQLMGSYEMIYNFYIQLSGYMAKIELLRKFYNEEQIEDGTVSLQEPLRTLALQRVDFAYISSSGNVLHQLDLELPIGKKIAFVGASGGGKSTIAQLLVRFYEPTAGCIVANGQDLRTIRRADWSSKTAIVFQTPYLFPSTIRSNLMFGRSQLTEGRLEWACRMAEIHDFIASLPQGYDTEIGERGIMLSGGQRQRIALARALLADTELLILDEATSSLDLETERTLQRNLDAVRQGRTTIIIAHRLSTIQNAELIYVMDQGRVAAQGTHASLMRSSALYRTMVADEQREHAGASGKLTS